MNTSPTVTSRVIGRQRFTASWQQRGTRLSLCTDVVGTAAERQKEYRLRQALDPVVIPVVVRYDVLPALAKINSALVECNDEEIRTEISTALTKIVNGLEAPSS